MKKIILILLLNFIFVSPLICESNNYGNYSKDTFETLRVEIMGQRYKTLIDACAGYEKTKVLLVGWNDKTRQYNALDLADDKGLYFFVPILASKFNLSLNDAIEIFYIGTILLFFSIGLIGCIILYHHNLIQLLIAVSSLLGLGLLTFKFGDVYIFNSVIVVVVTVWILVNLQNRKIRLSTYVIFSIASFFIGIFHYIRNHSGTGVSIFILLIIFVYYKSALKKKFLLLITMIIFLLIPVFYFNNLFAERDNFLFKNVESYQISQNKEHHVFWHVLYIALGYTSNDYVPAYLDQVGFEKLWSINPNVKPHTNASELIMKKEFFKLVFAHPFFFLRNIFAKLGVLLMYILFFANFGLLFALYYRKAWQIDTAFLLAIGFSSLYGLLVIPSGAYSLGLIAFVNIYSFYSVNYALERGAGEKITGFALQSWRRFLSQFKK